MGFYTLTFDILKILFLTVLDLVCRLSLVAANRGYSLIAVCRLLIAVASCVAEHRL